MGEKIRLISSLTAVFPIFVEGESKLMQDFMVILRDFLPKKECNCLGQC